MSAALRTQCLPGTLPIELVDTWPAGLRALTHEFGFSVVHAFVIAGVTRAGTIRQLVKAVYLGAREPGNARPAGSPPVRLLEDALVMHGAPGASRAILAYLRGNHHTVVPIEPTHHMLHASLGALDGAPLASRHTKHRMRLTAALKAADARLG